MLREQFVISICSNTIYKVKFNIYYLKKEYLCQIRLTSSHVARFADQSIVGVYDPRGT